MSKKKKCSKCGEIKELSEFHKNRRNKDGRISHCRECCKKEYQNRKYNLICQNAECGEEFVAKNTKAKYCSNCKPRRRTKEEINRDNQLGSKVCGHCLQRKDFSEFSCSKTGCVGESNTCKKCRTRKDAERTYKLTLSLIHISEPTRPY